jgi:hypothetical protein
VIVGFGLPKLSLSAKDLVRRFGSKALPTMENIAQLVVRNRFHYDVNVIGHDRPGMQPVALAIEMKKGLRNDSGYIVSLHPTRSMPSV